MKQRALILFSTLTLFGCAIPASSPKVGGHINTLDQNSPLLAQCQMIGRVSINREYYEHEGDEVIKQVINDLRDQVVYMHPEADTLVVPHIKHSGTYYDVNVFAQAVKCSGLTPSGNGMANPELNKINTRIDLIQSLDLTYCQSKSFETFTESETHYNFKCNEGGTFRIPK